MIDFRLVSRDREREVLREQDWVFGPQIVMLNLDSEAATTTATTTTTTTTTTTAAVTVTTTATGINSLTRAFAVIYCCVSDGTLVLTCCLLHRA